MKKKRQPEIKQQQQRPNEANALRRDNKTMNISVESSYRFVCLYENIYCSFTYIQFVYCMCIVRCMRSGRGATREKEE